MCNLYHALYIYLKYGSEEKGSFFCKCSILLGFVMSKKLRGLWFYLLLKVNTTSLGFFDIIKPRRIEHLQKEEPFSSDPYFNKCQNHEDFFFQILCASQKVRTLPRCNLSLAWMGIDICLLWMSLKKVQYAETFWRLQKTSRRSKEGHWILFWLSVSRLEAHYIYIGIRT